MQVQAIESPYPLLFAPVYKNYFWGGSRIAAKFARADAPGVCAESWEISAHKDGMCVVENGQYAGMTLAELSSTFRESLLGTNNPDGKFPLIAKIIDARERLSVQVHPNDDTAPRCGGEAKTEMWYVMDAPPGAFVCAGLKEGVGPRIFTDTAKERRIPSLLRSLPVEPGAAVFIPGGLVHAICENCLMFEVMQNSNTTYRVYDWDRVGADGKPRESHFRQALEVIDWHAPESVLQIPYPMPSQNPANKRERVLRCDFFTMERREINAPEILARDGRSFLILFAQRGAAHIKYGADRGSVLTLPHGRSCLIPASLRDFEIAPENDETMILTVEV